MRDKSSYIYYAEYDDNNTSPAPSPHEHASKSFSSEVVAVTLINNMLFK